MTLFEAIRARQSVRAFQDRPVEPGKLEAILQAVNQAPSAGNCQAYEVFLVRDQGLRRALVQCALGQEFLARAPLVLVFCAAAARCLKYGERGASLYALQDAAAAVVHAQLAATALGLATCWVGAFDEAQVSQKLQLPTGLRPVTLLPIGYAAEMPPRSPRRPLAELARELRPPGLSFS